MNELLNSPTHTMKRWGIASAGAILGLIAPVLPMILVFTFAVFVDCITAWRLSRRVRVKHPEANDGKFKSRHAGKVFNTLMLVYSLIWLGHLIQEHIIFGLSVALPNVIAGAACGWQLWSILENESSCNDAGWARFLQRFLVDKASRHFDFDIKDALREIRDEQRAQRNGLSAGGRRAGISRIDEDVDKRDNVRNDELSSQDNPDIR